MATLHTGSILANMASFNVRFVEKPPDDCCCPICLSVMNDPHLTSCCGRHYCQACITRIQMMAQPCPICKKSGFTTLFDRQLRNRISILRVHCPMEGKGCKWQGKYEELEQHLSVGNMKGECLYISLPCPFDCEESVTRRHISKHMKQECPNRRLRCQVCSGCGADGESDCHRTDCPDRFVDCPNGCPIPNIRFCNLNEHTSQLCPYRAVECKFHKLGCRAVFLFKDGPRHYIENTSQHLEYIRQFAMNQAAIAGEYLQLAQRNADLEYKHQQLEHKVSTLEEKCASYECSISELRLMIQSLKEVPRSSSITSQQLPRSSSVVSGRESWEPFSPPLPAPRKFAPPPVPPNKPVNRKGQFHY